MLRLHLYRSRPFRPPYRKPLVLTLFLLSRGIHFRPGQVTNRVAVRTAAIEADGRIGVVVGDIIIGKVHRQVPSGTERLPAVGPEPVGSAGSGSFVYAFLFAL